MGYTGQRPSAIPLTSADIVDGTITNDDLAGSITSAKITSLDATKLTGTVAPARMGSGTASSTTVLYGDNTYKAEPTTDLTPLRQDIAMLALYNAVSDNRAAYNLPFSFIDQFEDDTGLTTQTNVDRVTSGEYVASTYSSDVVTTPASASDYTGNTGSHTITSGGILVTTGDNSMYSDWSTGTGDYTVTLTLDTVGGIGIGMFDSSEAGTHADTDQAGLQNMTESYWWHKGYYSTKLHKGNATPATITEPAAGSVIKFQRTSGAIKFYDDGVLVYTFSGTNNNTMKFSISSDGRTGGEIVSLSFTASTSAANATGTLISDTQTSSVATTKMSGVILYKDNAGTATLGTDLVISLSADNGSNWTEAASYGTVTPLFSTGVKMVRLGETTVTSGTAPVIKAVWANQAASSKETQLHGWAMNY